MALSHDRRNILVTTNKIKSIKGLLKAATGREATAKVIPVLSVDRVQKGCCSKRFNQALEEDADLRDLLKEGAQTLSIIYLSPETDQLEYLDLVVENDDNFQVLLSSLQDLVNLCEEEKQRYTNAVQFLHYHWSQLNKPFESPMSVSEWITFIDKIGSPVKKAQLVTMFRDYCGENEDHLPFGKVALLVEDVKNASMAENSPIEALWKELVENDPVPAVGVKQQDDDASLELGYSNQEESISSVAFLSFLRSRQKEIDLTLDDVNDTCLLLCQQKTPEDLGYKNADSISIGYDRISRSRFLSYLFADSNDIMDPETEVKESQDMTHPLSHYWINTSHDTYLARLGDSFSGRSVYSKYKNGPELVDEQMYLAVLLRGVRCIEVDIWDGDDQAPVIARHQPAGKEKGIPLRSLLLTLRNFLEEYDPYSFPIIVNMENHCSPPVQRTAASMIYDILGAAKLIIEPAIDLDDAIALPSPEMARGKVILLGKRPKSVKPGAKVLNDDFDEENIHFYSKQPDTEKDDASYDENEWGVGTVVGFSSNGPILSADPDTYTRNPQDLCNAAEEDAAAAKKALKECQTKLERAERESYLAEKRAKELASNGGMSMVDVREKALKAASKDFISETGQDGQELFIGEDEKSPKDEGVEIHEVLPDSVVEGRDHYGRAAQIALEASMLVEKYKVRADEAKKSLKKAEDDLNGRMIRYEELVVIAQKAASEARSHKEHAEAAEGRVEKLREILKSSVDKASNAGNVVITAMTEAKISEKRAQDAETRAARALATALADKKRAEEETAAEEALEEKVNELYEIRQEHSNKVVDCRERAEKAVNMLERVNENILLIENNKTYQKEIRESKSSSGRFGSSLVAKHEAKVKEREMCKELISTAEKECELAEQARKKVQNDIEEATHLWRIQADVASQMRKVYDRSMHVYEELAEHAEEERDAANLRQTARAKAEETVETKGVHKHGLEIQLDEAERAFAEATSIFANSKERADRAAREAEHAKNFERFQDIVKERAEAFDIATRDLEAATKDKKYKDDLLQVEKRRLETDEEIVSGSSKKEDNLNKIKEMFKQEAIVAYNRSTMCLQRVREAAQAVKLAKSREAEKSNALRHARQYRDRMERIVEIPPTLARVTLLHSRKFQNWDKSLGLSVAYVHSFADHVLEEMMNEDAKETKRMMQAFTRKHLCRVFPSWKEVCHMDASNYDPLMPYSLGAQLVAMNFHSNDERSVLVDGRFRQNGSCGYVLKPSYLTGEGDGIPPQTWFFTVLAGSYIPPPPGRSTYTGGKIVTNVTLYTGSRKEPVTYETGVARGNRLNPTWDSSVIMQFEVTKPSISMFCFSVWDKSNDRFPVLLATAAVPVNCIRPGLRSVSLFSSENSKFGPYEHASLLVSATDASDK